MNKYQTTVAILAIAILLTGAMKWMDKRDKAVLISVDRYEECVRNEYNTTPSAWYMENGEYPYCESK